MTPSEQRLALLRAGFNPLPLSGKLPVLKEWQKRTDASEGDIDIWAKIHADAINTGILTKSCPALDIDILNQDAAKAVEELVRERFEEGGYILVRIGLPPKRAIPFRCDQPFKKITALLIPPNGGSEEKLEFLADGQQLCAFGIHPDTREPYEWFGGQPGGVRREDLPYIHEQQAQQLVDDAAELLYRDFGYRRAGDRPRKDKNNSGVGTGALDWAALVENIRKGHALHDSLRDLSGKLVASGMKAGAAVNFLRGLMDNAECEHDTRWKSRRDDVPRLVESAATREADDTHTFTVTATPHSFPAERSIRQWDFLYGVHLLRRTVSGTAATGATGKSSLSLVEALAMASGKLLLGVHVPRPLRVMWINLEDNRDTVDKRIAAAMRHHKLKPEDIGDRLYTQAKGELSFKIAAQTRVATVKNRKVIDGLIAFLRAAQIDVLSIDPFIKTHGVNENDNTAIGDVVDCYDAIAEGADCAVSLWHHTRKGGALGATVESARGAGSFVDACRSVRILETMSKDEAKKQKIERHRSYFRVFSGKLNFAPPTDASDWYRFVSLHLDNGGTLFGDDGDSVGVVERWEHPGAAEADLTPENVAAIKTKLGTGEWREDPRAAMWAGKAVGQVLGLDPEDDAASIKKALKTLIADGALKTIAGRTENRKPCLLVVPADWSAEVTPLHRDDPGKRFRVVGKATKGAACVECHQSDGEVFKIKLAVPGVKPETLHKKCAAKWFGEPS